MRGAQSAASIRLRRKGRSSCLAAGRNLLDHPFEADPAGYGSIRYAAWTLALTSDQLYRALTQQGASSDLRPLIQPGVVAFRRGRLERGRSAPIEMTEGSTIHKIDEQNLANLMDAFLQGMLDAIELEYVANAIELSGSLSTSGPLVDDILLELSSPEISRDLTRSVVEDLARRIHAA